MPRMGERNAKVFHYATYKGKTEIIDPYGNVTGYSEIEYNEPVEMRARISPAKGKSDIDFFGVNLNYSRTITTTDMNCSIDENTVLWVDEQDITKPHDYEVVSVAKDINYIVYAIKKVNVG